MGQKSVMPFVVAFLISLWCSTVSWSGFSVSWSGFRMPCCGLVISWCGLSR